MCWIGTAFDAALFDDGWRVSQDRGVNGGDSEVSVPGASAHAAARMRVNPTIPGADLHHVAGANAWQTASLVALQ